MRTERNVSCATVVRTQGPINPTRAHCVRATHPPQKLPLSISLLSKGFPIQCPDISNVGFTAGPFERQTRWFYLYFLFFYPFFMFSFSIFLFFFMLHAAGSDKAGSSSYRLVVIYCRKGTEVHF